MFPPRRRVHSPERRYRLTESHWHGLCAFLGPNRPPRRRGLPLPPPSAVGGHAARVSKTLTPSAAQRKGTGNQRGSITLVQAGYPINAQTYFRKQFFGDATWAPERTRTGERRERATVPFSVDFL